MAFAKLCAEVVEEARPKGINKPVVASLVGNVQVEEASEYLYEHGVVAYPYTTELPIAVLARSTNGRAERGCCRANHFAVEKLWIDFSRAVRPSSALA